MEPGLMTVIPLVKVKMPLRLSLRHQSESRPSPHPVSHLTLWWAHSFIFKSQACLLIVLGAPFSFPENTGQNSLFAACLHACRPEASDALELELHVDRSWVPGVMTTDVYPSCKMLSSSSANEGRWLVGVSTRSLWGKGRHLSREIRSRVHKTLSTGRLSLT